MIICTYLNYWSDYSKALGHYMGNFYGILLQQKIAIGTEQHGGKKSSMEYNVRAPGEEPK